MPDLPNNSVENTWQFCQQIIRQHVSPNTVSLSLKTYHCIDPILLLKLLDEHRLELIAYTLFKNNALKEASITKQLQSLCQKYLYQHLQQQKCLTHLVKYLQEQNISYAVFKGQVLNHLLYDTQCLRRSRDIDLVIDPAGLLRAHHYLLEQGFQLTSHITPDILLKSKKLLNLYKDLNYENAHSKITVELHCQLTWVGNLGLSYNQADMLSTVCIAHQPIVVFDAEHHFFYLCVHAAFHNWRRFQRVVDLAIFYQKYPMDWKKIYAIAKKNHCLRVLQETRILFANLFNIILPKIPSSITDNIVTKIRLRYAQLLWKQPLYADQKKRINLEPYLEIFICSLLFSKLHQKFNYLIGLPLYGEKNITQLKKHPNRPLWLVALMALLRKLFTRPPQTTQSI